MLLIRTNALIIGPICTGKTDSLRTLLPEYERGGKAYRGANRTVLTLALEPGVIDTIGDCTCEMGMHFASVSPFSVDWDILEGIAERVGASASENIVKVIDPNKRSYTQFLEVYSKLKRFVCERCEHDFGPVDKLDETYAVAMDGLTGLSKMSMHFTAGLKPVKTWNEYDAAGQLIENLLSKCCNDLRASFILLGHVDREKDEVHGSRMTVHTIGQKLAPRLTKDLFSEIVVARREDARNSQKFFWSTVEPNFDLKARKLPFSDSIEPDFSLLLAMKALKE